MFGRATFEVQLFKNGRWAISEVVKSETVARKKAADLLALKTTAGVRIIKESHFGKDNHRESEIFKEMKEVKEEEDLSVTPVDEAPLCDKVTDFYKTASRTTMARLFTKYLEKFEMTPLEMLHSHPNLKRMVNYETMVPLAVDKIATLHARATGEGTRERRDAIFDAVEVISQKARDVDKVKLPALADSSLDEILKRLDAKFSDEEERGYMANVAFTRESLNWRGWLGKMTELLPMAQSQKDQRARDMIDEMLSDIFLAKTVIKDVIGISRHLGDAVLRMIDLVEGECAPTKFAADDLVKLLNPLFKEDLLPRSKKVLFDRIERDLTGPVRLTNSEDKADDKVFFDTLMDRVITDGHVIGGRALAAGLTERWARLDNIGGAAGRNKAMQGLCDKLDTGKRVFVYLLALYSPKAEASLQAAIEEQLKRQGVELNTIQKIAPQAKTERARLMQVTSTQRLVLDSELRDVVKKALAKRFDDIVVDYIIGQKVIERIDNKDLSFRERAGRLVAFCSSGMLTEGRATDIARETVTDYLKRKDFLSEFTTDIPDPKDKETAIRDFYKLLTQTGFQVG
ncbi:MAG: hypothetical protein HOH20_12075 [Rhodospirillaceae bacterium]|nr:hypothetical protein [Rhodospirillaceae bacterium]MBT6090308.1 hypothetical protein [Rhodospirillaceae bacterium]